MCLFEPRTAIHRKARSVEFILILKSIQLMGLIMALYESLSIIN
ncbi:hypothetical protein [Leptospira interrogans]|nr:hypothetical protein [Leptospira interrogans]